MTACPGNGNLNQPPDFRGQRAGLLMNRFPQPFMTFVHGGKLFFEFLQCPVNFFHLSSPFLTETLRDRLNVSQFILTPQPQIECFSFQRLTINLDLCTPHHACLPQQALYARLKRADFFTDDTTIANSRIKI
jgi:hypothetical protein